MNIDDNEYSEKEEREKNYQSLRFLSDCLRKINRQWKHALTGKEYEAVMFVLDRTLGWSKEWERITFAQCAEGIWSEEGKCYAAPFASNRIRAGQTIKKLVERGVLLTKKSKRIGDTAKIYKINTAWKPDKAMKIPQRLLNNIENDQEAPVEDDG